MDEPKRSFPKHFSCTLLPQGPQWYNPVLLLLASPVQQKTHRYLVNRRLIFFRVFIYKTETTFENT